MTPKYKSRVDEIVRHIHIRNWDLWVSPVTANRSEGTETHYFEIGARCEEMDADGENYVFVRGFSQLLPQWADAPTIVEAAFDLVERLQRHELREFFTYRGKQILDPHNLPKPKKNVRRKKRISGKSP